jgi:23S rRNA pseudouridine1911/1915/1917 synthase
MDLVKNIKIIADENDFFIVYKPAGLIVHSGKGVKEESLSDILSQRFPELKNVGEDPDRPAIVHRLDKEVSGLLIIPKNQTSFFYFKDQFKNHLITKKYTALVYGHILKEEGLINFPIARSKKGGKMAALPMSINNENNNRNLGNQISLLSSKKAETHFSLMQRYVNYSLLKVKIKTGRTHQIRVHLSAYGHPIVGDNIYGNKKARLANKKHDINRVFLEADYLSFLDQKGRKYEYKLKISSDLQKILTILK